MGTMSDKSALKLTSSAKGPKSSGVAQNRHMNASKSGPGRRTPKFGLHSPGQVVGEGAFRFTERSLCFAFSLLTYGLILFYNYN